MADFQLGFKANSSPLSDILPQSPKGAACLELEILLLISASLLALRRVCCPGRLRYLSLKGLSVHLFLVFM